MNWFWYYFDTESDAAAFNAAVLAKWGDPDATRGVYPPTDRDPRWGVRVRPWLDGTNELATTHNRV